MLQITIDGKTFTATLGETILQVAKRNNIYIPTLCADDRLKHFTSCFVCVVEVEGMPGFKTACSTEISADMKVKTDTEAIREARRYAMNLLLSNHFGDCIAPCQIRCPAHVDVQGYIAHVANHNYDEAVALIRKTNPFPLSTGKVCTHPCETDCRRNFVDKAVAIKNLKRCAVDNVLAESEEYIRPETEAETGKRVAVIGAGPAGLTCAYFLRTFGHSVEVFEQMDAPGGMLRYGIPEYRLPKVQLDHEIAQITTLGIKTHYNQKLGQDITFSSLKEQGFDAIFLGMGAWKGSPMRIEGEKGEGVFVGIDYLRKVIQGEKVPCKGTIVVVGGGNTAIDVVRTATRLGFERVILAYRRTRNEMPADIEEIEQAEEENVEFHFLTAPVAVKRDENDKILGMMLQKMELGEADSSGRRRPVPVPGSDFLLEADTIVSAIGQAPDPSFLTDTDDPNNKGIGITRWGSVEVNDKYMTGSKGIFAGGDQVLGPMAAIDAIGQGKEAAYAIDQYFGGTHFDPYVSMNVHKEDFMELSDELFAHYDKIDRQKMETTPPETRKNFKEVELGYSNEVGDTEASRCLECGCQAVHSCDLRRIGTETGAHAKAYPGEVSRNRMDQSNPFITREMDKCILCGRCVRLCDEYLGVSALSFANRGFKATIEPTLGRPLAQSTCITCGICVEGCPTGALNFTPDMSKPGPFETELYPSTCNLCATGCRVHHEFTGSLYYGTRSAGDLAPNKLDLCGRGYFALRKEFKVDSLQEEIDMAELKTQLTNSADNFHVLLSPRMTMEEGLLAGKILKDHLNINSFSVAGSTLSPITKEKQQLKYADIEEADAILLIGDQLEASFPILYQRLYGYHAKGIVGVISSTEDRISHNAHKRIALPHGEFTVNFNEEVKAFFSGANKPLMVVNSKGMPEGCLRAIMALAKEVGVDCRIPATAGNELGLQLLELPQATPGADHKILILGTVAEEAIPAGAKELFYLGGTPLENQGIFINHEGRASIVTALTEETTLLEKLQELAEATGAKAVTLEALKEELYQKHTFLKGDYSPVTEGFIVH